MTHQGTKGKWLNYIQPYDFKDSESLLRMIRDTWSRVKFIPPPRIKGMESKTMIDKTVKWHEFFCDAPIANLTRSIREAFEQGKRFIWNCKGMRKEVPREAVENVIDLVNDYESRTRNFDRIPKSAGHLFWELTIDLPDDAPASADDLHDRGRSRTAPST